jgi:septal ring factor EnvC (AmiA/AmiB activator)
MNSKDINFVDEKLFKRISKDIKLIEFGEEFYLRSDRLKIEYLVKLASSLNHAAVTIQEERNKLNDLLYQKERQLVSCKKQRSQEQEMIQKQLLKENATKQAQAERLETLTMEKKRLLKEIKRLQDGDKH